MSANNLCLQSFITRACIHAYIHSFIQWVHAYQVQQTIRSSPPMQIWWVRSPTVSHSRHGSPARLSPSCRTAAWFTLHTYIHTSHIRISINTGIHLNTHSYIHTYIQDYSVTLGSRMRWWFICGPAISSERIDLTQTTGNPRYSSIIRLLLGYFVW